jgi:hypothetical protein
MSSTVTKTLIALAAVVLMVPVVNSQAQEKEQIVNLGPEVGETIDRQERDRYELFPASENFHSAVIVRRADGSYAAEITETDEGVKKTRNLPIDQSTVELLRERFSTPRPRSGKRLLNKVGPRIRIEVRDGQRFTGSIQDISQQSLTISQVYRTDEFGRQQKREKDTTVTLNDISQISLPRRSRALKGTMWGLVPLTLGVILGAAADDPGVFINPGAILAGLGIISGFVVGSVGGSVGAMNGVDVDVAWEGMSEPQRKAVLEQISGRQYRSRTSFKVSPFAGIMSPPDGEMTAVMGASARFYLTPRSGLEVTYGRTRWFSKEQRFSPYYASRKEKLRMEYFSGGCFIYASRGRTINPFIGWGWGRTSTTSDRYDDAEVRFAITFSGGLEIPLSNAVSLEGRFGNVGALFQGHHPTIQLALTFGPNH